MYNNKLQVQCCVFCCSARGFSPTGGVRGRCVNVCVYLRLFFWKTQVKWLQFCGLYCTYVWLLNTVYCYCAHVCSMQINSKCVRVEERTTGSGLLTRVVQCLRDVLMRCVDLLMGELYQTRSYNRGQEFSDIFLRVSRVDWYPTQYGSIQHEAQASSQLA